MTLWLVRISILVGAFSLGLGCGSDTGGGGGDDDIGRCASFNPLRDPFFGETHAHTTLSLDAATNGTLPGPEEAYAFARDGAEIGLQPYDDQGNPSRSAQIARTIDFVMLSDHAEFLGTVAVCQDPSTEGYNHPQCVDFREDPGRAMLTINANLSFPPQSATYPDLCGEDASECLEAGMDVWGAVQDAAEAAYDRSSACEFSSFVGYEWSAAPASRNLHRNIIFRNENVPAAAIGYFDAPYVELLWDALNTMCMDAGTGCEAFAIPHNSNLGAGTFFEDRRCNREPLNEAYAAARNALEPIIEVYQHKGASECLPGEPIPDELCGFEVIPFDNLGAANQEILRDPNPKDFVRSAFGEGMKFEESLGTNPFKHGMISATDTHIAAPGFDEEDNFKGHGGAGQPNRDEFPEGFPDIKYLSPGGLAGVWAEENSRGALFEAMQRKETFATSGTRIVPRFFGGWELSADLCDDPDFVEVGYELGVPMGGDLLDPPPDGKPKFIVHAKQDTEAAPLQRIQIIKGWIEDGESKVEVFDVAGDATNGASLDLTTCEPQGTGFADLCAVWEDEGFDPAQRAYYYARIIENPTCRWTVQQCVEAGYDCDNPTTEMDEVCCDPTTGLNVDFCDDVVANATDLSGMEAACCRTDNPTSWENVAFCDSVAGSLPPADGQCCRPRLETSIQERAWTSPIWYSPEGGSDGPIDTSGIAEECVTGDTEFQQEAKYEILCSFASVGQVFDLLLTITVEASVEPDGVLVEGVETDMTHSANMLAPLIATLPNLAPDARISVASAGVAISNASPTEAQNELEGTPAPVVPDIDLNIIDTPVTADGAGPVTLDLVAFELSMTGLVTADGMELVPGGESQITEESEECGPIMLAPDSQPISFELAP